MLEHVYAAGEWRRLGNVAAPIRFAWREFGSVPKERLIPRSEWKDLVDQVGTDSECGQLPPVTNQQDVGQCFPAGTRIRMANGCERPIEKIQVLDEVLTAEGNVKPVLRVTARKATSLLRVQVWGGRHLRCTEEHPILTQRGYVPAGQLTREDWVAMPRFASQSDQVTHHETRDDWRSRQDDQYVWRKVDGTLYEPFDGYVFNLEVADDHSYVAEGVGVHNCNANATVSAMEYSRKIQGLPYVQLSPADLYHQINGGRDQGSLLEDGIKAAMNVGVGTVADCGSDVWKRGYRPATKEQRAKYRVLEAVLCPTFDHCASAVLHGFGLISGIMWYQNYEPGQDGWLPPGRGGSGGHAIFGYKLTYRNGGREWGIWHQNSWGERWGQKGRFVIPESAYSGPVGGWWAVCQMVTEQGDLPPLAKEES